MTFMLGGQGKIKTKNKNKHWHPWWGHRNKRKTQQQIRDRGIGKQTKNKRIKNKKNKELHGGGIIENHTNKSNQQNHQRGIGKQTQKQNPTKRSMMVPKRNTEEKQPTQQIHDRVIEHTQKQKKSCWGQKKKRKKPWWGHRNKRKKQ